MRFFKRRGLTLIFLSVALTLFSMQSIASHNATLTQNESQLFQGLISLLTERLNDDAGFTRTERIGKAGSKITSRKLTLIRFEGCTLSYLDTGQCEMGGEMIGQLAQRVRLHMSDIDPSKIKVEAQGSHFVIRLSTVAGKTSIRSYEQMLMLGSINHKVSSVAEVLIPFQDKRAAKGISKVFKRAIELCKKTEVSV